MPFYFIRPVGLPEREQAWLESILTIARGMLHDVWQWTTDEVADVHMIAVESLAEWEHYRKELSDDRLLAYVLPGLEIDTRWQIQRNRESPPSLPALARTLNAMGAELTSASSHAPAAQASKPVTVMPRSAPEPTPQANRETVQVPATETAADQYDPAHHVIGIIREALADSTPRLLICEDGGGAVLIDPERKLYFTPGDTIASPLLTAPREKIQTQPLSSGQLARETVAMGAHGLALNDLIFLAALLGSQGRLWANARRDEPVRLKQWPNLKRLPDYTDYIGLMAFMSSNTADVNTIAKHTGASENRVINFYNACAALDLLDKGGKISIREKPLNPDIRDLYGKIAKRLRSNA